MVSFLQSLLLLFHFCVFLSQLSELVWKLAEEISLQSASKCFQSFGPLANGNKSNAKKSRFCPNRNLTGTIYHWSVILRSFSVVLNSAKRDANGFFKVLLLSSHLLISGHPVQKSKFGACTVTGYCSFKFSETQGQSVGSGEGATKVRARHSWCPAGLHYGVTVVVVVRPWLSTMTKNITWEKD